MEPEGLSEEAVTSPYPEAMNPDHAFRYCLTLRSVLILSSHIKLGLLSDLFISDLHVTVNVIICSYSRRRKL